MAADGAEDALLAEYVLGYVRRRKRERDERPNLFDKYDDREFSRRFRLSKDTVRRVLEEINLPTPTRRHGILPDEKLLIALRYFATGTFQLCMADFTDIDQGTVSCIVWEVSAAVARLARNYITMPMGGEQATVMAGFHSMARFPRVVGAIDCCHMGIASPGGDTAELFRNRKGVFSVNCQMVVDYNLKIRSVTAHHPGSVHDQTILDGSWLRIKFDRGDFNHGLLLGDSGYACSRWLLTPVPNPGRNGERLYNESLIRTRNCAERAFGVLKRRFPVLNKIRVDFERVEAVIVACTVLHNICIEERDIWEEDPLPANPPDIPGNVQDGNYGVGNDLIAYFDGLE